MAPAPRAFTSLEDPNANNTLGAALIGVVGSGILFGISSLQGYLYYHRYPTDGRLHKIAVAVLWLLDSLHLALTIHAVYYYLVVNSGRHEALTHIVWSLKLQVSINVIIILIVQSLYAKRVWFLGNFRRGLFKVAYLVALIVAGGFAIGILLAYTIWTVDTFQSLERISWAINASLASSTTIDFTISAAMCYYLDKTMISSSTAQVSGLNTRMSALMQYTLGSGLITSACSLSTLFTYNLMPNNFIFLALEFLLTKLYVGSFLAMLNSRKRKRGDTGESSNATTSIPLPTVVFQVHTTVTTESVVSPPHTPASPSHYSESGSTFVSCDEAALSKDKDTWSDAESAVLPKEFACKQLSPREIYK